MRGAGHTIVGAYARSEASMERLENLLPGVPAAEIKDISVAADMILLAVPDDELGPLVDGMARLGLFRQGHLVVHVAGRYGTSVLAPAVQSGAIALALHPAMTFTGTSLDLKRLIDCPIAVTGNAMFLPIGEALAVEMEGRAVVVAEEDVRRGKPDPEGFRAGAALLGREPTDVLVFEDSVPGIRGALAAGMRCIAVGTAPGDGRQ